jgi:hypothetical protein
MNEEGHCGSMAVECGSRIIYYDLVRPDTGRDPWTQSGLGKGLASVMSANFVLVVVFCTKA